MVLRYCKKLRVPTNPLNPSFCFRGRSSATSVGASGETPQLTGISRFLGTRNLHHRSQQTFHCKTQQPEDSLFCQLPNCQLPNFQLPETCGSFIIAPFLFSVKGVYRSTSCGTLNKSGVSQVLPRTPVSQAPVWSFPIVHLFRPPFKVEPHGYKVHLILIVRPELLPEGPVEPFHHSIELWRPWGKDEELDTVFLTGLLKLPIEFAPSIYLNGPHWKGGTFRSSSRNTLARLAVALKWREE